MRLGTSGTVDQDFFRLNCHLFSDPHYTTTISARRGRNFYMQIFNAKSIGKVRSNVPEGQDSFGGQRIQMVLWRLDVNNFAGYDLRPLFRHCSWWHSE